MYLKTVAPDAASGDIATLYHRDLDQRGFVMATTACMTTRPDLLPLYEQFSAGIRSNFSLGARGWRLITLIAAKQVPSSYCSHVYAQALAADLGSKEAVLAVQQDFRNAGLGAKDIAMLAYAEKIARNASEIRQSDIDALRQSGFSDLEISDIALCASFRCFVARFFDATGAGPEPVFIDPDPEFSHAMSVGKPVGA